MRWRLERISRDEVVVLEEVSASFRREENNRGEDHQENAHGKNIVHSVVRVEGDAVEGFTVGILVRLDFDAVRVVGAYFMQCDQMRHHQT